MKALNFVLTIANFIGTIIVIGMGVYTISTVKETSGKVYLLYRNYRGY